MKTLLRLTLVALAALITVHSPAFAQGSLTPPAGPPTPVMKTLDQLEPRIPIGPDTTPGDNDQLPSLYKITQPGSYYLTGNLTGVSNKCGIEIVTSDVTLDLGGFVLEGTTNSRMAIFVASGTSRITIRNGGIRNWSGHDGIHSFGMELNLANLMLADNGIDGVRSAGSAIITDCVATGHAGDRGFYVGQRGVFTRVVARNGFRGIEAGQGSTLVDCVASYNSVTGFKVADATLTRCTANNNNGNGFDGSGVFQQCLARNNGAGFYGYGIFEACAARWNNTSGFNVFQATVANCQASSNGEHGIRVGGNSSRIVGNQCIGNGATTNGAGIHLPSGYSSPGRHEVANNVCNENSRGIEVHSSLNRIADNHLAENSQYGLNVTGQYNLIIRNTARNTAAGAVNWNIAQFNRAGAYVAPANNAAISGNTGGNGSGTTDPFANVSF